MPSGAAVIRYEGPRGVVWRIKYADADGRQVKETLGREAEGWTRQKAERALGVKLDAVERGLRKPRKRKCSDLADEFLEVALPAKPRKKSTSSEYRGMLRNHLRPEFDEHDLVTLSRRPEVFERYAAAKLADGLSPKTVRNHLVLLGLMFKSARRWRWVAENPLDVIERPPIPDLETETLDAASVAAVLKAYRELEARADEDEDRHWYASARRMTTIALSTGLRRGELLGLRWMDVEFLDRRLHVRQAFVRNEMTTPKSRAGLRTIPLGDVAIAALEEQFSATKYQAPESIVFCHRALGTPLDPSKLRRYSRTALDRAGVDPSFRPWHGLRHTALTETAAAGVPAMFVQAKAGHAQGSTTERYLHAARTNYPDSAELAEARLFGEVPNSVPVLEATPTKRRKAPQVQGFFSSGGRI
jgi:integrase